MNNYYKEMPTLFDELSLKNYLHTAFLKIILKITKNDIKTSSPKFIQNE